MTALFIAPHSDDETLFGAFTIMAHDCDVVVVAEDPDIAAKRRTETWTALAELKVDDEVTATFLAHTEKQIDGAGLVLQFGGMTYDRVFAPAWEEDGNVDHNIVARAAAAAFGDLVTPYLTYTSRGRSRDGREVGIGSEWIAAKLRALACYRTQHEHPARRPWFYDLLDMREWYA